MNKKLLKTIFTATDTTLSKYSIPENRVNSIKISVDSTIIKSLLEYLFIFISKDEQIATREIFESLVRNPKHISNTIENIKQYFPNELLSRYLPKFIEKILPKLLKEFDKSLVDYLNNNTPT